MTMRDLSSGWGSGAGWLRPAAAVASLLAAGPALAQDCDRACLEGWVDTYLDALIAGDPAAAPLADDVRFTANGQELAVGEGLWRTMKDRGTYRLYVTDVPAQQVAVLTTFVEDGPAPEEAGAGGALALRLKIEDGRIAEIEQMEIRDARQYARMEAHRQPRDAFFEEVPAVNRMSRADLIETANKYFTGMQMNDGKGDYPFADDCDRLENGNRATNAPTPPGETRPDPLTATTYSAQWTCREQFESGLLRGVSLIRDRRFVAVDEERGLVWAFGFFDHHRVRDVQTVTLPDGEQTITARSRPWTWHIGEVFKVEDGLIHEIEAYLYEPPYGMRSGWSNWEDGMSDRARNETGVQ
jgi:hypothetical protein